jgi:predicted RNase H-like HicB family nuclease
MSLLAIAFRVQRKSEVNKVYFPALIEKDEDSDFGASFPDFPGCVSAGETLEEAVLGAQEALAGHVALMVADGDELPKPTPLGEVAQERETSTGTIRLIPLVMPRRRCG